MSLPLTKSLFENKMGNPFLKKKIVMIKTLKKEFRKEIWTFSFKICFWNQFRTSGSDQTEITPIMQLE